MSIRTIFSIVILGLGLTAAMIPGKKNNSIALNERELLQEMLLEDNHLTVDEVAELLISADPSVQLIDVRTPAEFEKDALPRAINIPYDSIFSENFVFMLDQTVTKNVIYGMDDARSSQVWMITKQLGYNNNYLMKGGIKAWKDYILNPEMPPQTAPQEEVDLYMKRVASKQFFTGAQTLPSVQIQPIVPVGGRKKKKVQGGCS